MNGLFDGYTMKEQRDAYAAAWLQVSLELEERLAEIRRLEEKVGWLLRALGQVSAGFSVDTDGLQLLREEAVR